jgi:ABC-type multidrug transport system fused ATPase/permease subunit
LQDWDRVALSEAVMRVDQEVKLFTGTLRENITLWDETVSTADVQAAAFDAGLEEVIANFREGLDGRIDEAGANLSGGQRQRVEIARALVRQPALLILDEATSALDPLTEQSVLAAIRRRGVTCVIIAHRLSTIRDCDEIIFLDRGRAIERGTHKQLMKLGGRYTELIREE